jgi:crossover junction endodeoxyribonuclease RuvC
MIILGMDPGVTGAIAYYDTNVEKVTHVCDMPTEMIAVAGKSRPRVSAQGVRKLLWESNSSHLAIEKVGGLPGQSGSASFNFGRGVGVIIGIAAAMEFELEEIPPVTWKAKLRVPKDKVAAATRASEMVPHLAYEWRAKSHADRAEAAMIAIYARRYLWTKETVG